MANKKTPPLSEEEKVAAILNKIPNINASKVLGASLDITSKCVRCGKELSGLEKVTFFKKCATCAKRDAQAARENFFKRYSLLTVSIIALVLLSSFFKYSENSAMRIIGLVFEGIFVCVSVFYICFDALPLILPDKLNKKNRLLISLGFAVGIGMTVITVEISGDYNYKALFIIFALLVCAYAAYKGYRDYEKMKELHNLVEVYERKSKDENYVKEVSEAISEKADQSITVQKTEKCNFCCDSEASSVADIAPKETEEAVVGVEETQVVSKHSIEVKEEKKDVPEKPKETKNEKKDDEGDCWII